MYDYQFKMGNDYRLDIKGETSNILRKRFLPREAPQNDGQNSKAILRQSLSRFIGAQDDGNN